MLPRHSERSGYRMSSTRRVRLVPVDAASGAGQPAGAGGGDGGAPGRRSSARWPAWAGAGVVAAPSAVDRHRKYDVVR